MKTVVLVSSCDAFSDCWPPMIYSLNKFWPDCPYPIYFISNYNKIKDEKIKFINVGKDKGFASNLKYSLNEIECDLIIYFQEDYFLVKEVNTEAIMDHINYCYEKNIDFLKIHSNDFLFRDNFRIGDSDYCINPIETRYSINTSIAIWKKETLMQLCIDGYSGWDWERQVVSYIKLNKIIIHSEIIHSSSYKEKSIVTIPGGAVAKGRWTQNGIDFLQVNGFKDLIKRREVEGKVITCLAVFYNHHPKSICRFPVVIILRFLLKFKFNF